VVQALQHVGAVGFTYLEDHFPPDCPDETWIPAVGARGWIAVTRDKNIARKRRQRELVAASQLRLFVFSQHAEMNRLDMLDALIRFWRRMLEYSAEHDPPSLVTIGRDGTFRELLLPAPAQL
jgi:hypothetical protein